jgi:hypothetical protein
VSGITIFHNILLIDLIRTRNHLEPLAIAAKIHEAPDCTLDTVPLTLGLLFHTYNDPRVEVTVREKIHESLERRWKNADQDLFISALLLNPFIRDKIFTGSRIELSRVGLYNIVKRVAERILRVTTDADFHSALMDYLNNSTEFSQEYLQADLLKEFYDKQVSQKILIVQEV